MEGRCTGMGWDGKGMSWMAKQTGAWEDNDSEGLWRVFCSKGTKFLPANSIHKELNSENKIFHRTMPLSLACTMHLEARTARQSEHHAQRNPPQDASPLPESSFITPANLTPHTDKDIKPHKFPPAPPVPPPSPFLSSPHSQPVPTHSQTNNPTKTVPIHQTPNQ